eukprot:833249-Pleurochrysis_carterae.AAC.1
MYAGAVTDAMCPVQIRAAVAKYKEHGPVQDPERVGLEKEPTSEDQATLCDVKATHVLRVARSEGERGEVVWEAQIRSFTVEGCARRGWDECRPQRSALFMPSFGKNARRGRCARRQ